MAEHGFHHVYFHKEPAKAQRPWFGQIYFGRTTWYTHYCETPEDAAKAADRYLYKFSKPTNFPVTAELAAELDGLTLEDIDEQFRQQGRQQAQAQKAPPTKAPGKSQYRGVSFDKSKGKWLASLTIRGQSVRLGLYQKQKDAAMAYDAATYIRHGGVGHFNFPDRFEHLTQEAGEAIAVKVLTPDVVTKITTMLDAAPTKAKKQPTKPPHTTPPPEPTQDNQDTPQPEPTDAQPSHAPTQPQPTHGRGLRPRTGLRLTQVPEGHIAGALATALQRPNQPNTHTKDTTDVVLQTVIPRQPGAGGQAWAAAGPQPARAALAPAGAAAAPVRANGGLIRQVFVQAAAQPTKQQHAQSSIRSHHSHVRGAAVLQVLAVGPTNGAAAGTGRAAAVAGAGRPAAASAMRQMVQNLLLSAPPDTNAPHGAHGPHNGTQDALQGAEPSSSPETTWRNNEAGAGVGVIRHTTSYQGPHNQGTQGHMGHEPINTQGVILSQGKTGLASAQEHVSSVQLPESLANSVVVRQAGIKRAPQRPAPRSPHRRKARKVAKSE